MPQKQKMGAGIKEPIVREGYYPRKANIMMPSVYSTFDRFGDPIHSRYGGQPNMGDCRTGAGTWWPDFGPTVRDFSPGGVNHPTEFVFEHEVLPFTAAFNRTQSEPVLKEPPPVQFRHPAPATEALWKSTDVMPYKSAGRRKCGESQNWRAAMSSGAEGCRHGGRMPIFCKGPLLDNPDFHQLHPLKRDEEMATIHRSCVKEQLAAGAATGTSPVDGLLLSSKTSQSLGMRDSETLRRELTINRHKDVPHSATFSNASRRLTGNAESFQQNARSSLTFSPTAVQAMVRSPQSQVSPKSVQFDADSASSMCSDAFEEKMPNWIARQTVASRDPGAAGGQAGPTSIRRITLTRTT